MKIAEGHVDPSFGQPTSLRHAVPPAVLAGSSHHHQTAMFQLEAVRLFTFDASFTFEQEPSSTAQRQCCDCRVFAELRLVVGMHAHIVATIAIVVEKDVIERCPRLGFNP